MDLDDFWFNAIKSGEKKYEIRVYDEKRRGVQLLDTIEFENKLTHEILYRKVVGLLYFESFDLAYYGLTEEEREGMLPCPYVNCSSDWLGLYESIPGYLEKSKKYGVLAIKLE